MKSNVVDEPFNGVITLSVQLFRSKFNFFNDFFHGYLREVKKKNSPVTGMRASTVKVW